MEDFYYYKSFRKTTVMFLDLFNGIEVQRFDQGGTFERFIKVPIKYSPKEKIFYWLNERKDDEMLPIMSATLTGVDYSLERAVNKNQLLCTGDTTTGISTQKFLSPVPYDLTFQVSLWTLYMSDIDQILEQILPWFQPYVMIRIHSPELNSTFDVKVIFNSATPEHEFEYTDDTFRILKYTLDFTVQTYMFKPVETVGVIKTILTNFFTNPNALQASSETGSTFSSGASGESIRLTGVEPWKTVDNDPIYDYEIFENETRLGGDDRVLIDLSTAPDDSTYNEYKNRTDAAIISAGYTTTIQVDLPSAGIPGITHMNHRIKEIDGLLYTFNASASTWIPHT